MEPAGIGTVSSLHDGCSVEWLPGFQRASPSTPLDVKLCCPAHYKHYAGGRASAWSDLAEANSASAELLEFWLENSRPIGCSRHWQSSDCGRRGAGNTSRATGGDDCIFCSKPALGDDEKALIAHRGERCFVMLNAFPYNNGHVMVAPFEHTARLQDLDESTAAELMGLTQRSLRALEDGLLARRLQRRREPGRDRRRRSRGPRSSACRAALGGRHELHAGRRRHARDARRGSTRATATVRDAFSRLSGSR